MKWVVTKRGEKYRKRLKLDTDDWLVLIIVAVIANVALITMILEGV